MLRPVAAIALSLAVCAGAQARTWTIADEWRGHLGRSARHLESGRHDEALRIAERVLRQMQDRLGPGDAATVLLGVALTHKAVALAGKGKNDEALWWWHVVISMYPAFATTDLSPFGAPGAFLDANRQPRAAATKGLELPAEQPPGAETITPPRYTKGVEPRFPHGALWFGVEGRLIVEVMITREGMVTAPVIVQPLPAPTLNYAALDAIRQWQFEPAKIAGEPVDVIFHISVNYKIRK